MLTIISDARGVFNGFPNAFGSFQDVFSDAIKVFVILASVINTISVSPIFAVKWKNKLEFCAAKNRFVVSCGSREGFTQGNHGCAKDISCTLISVVNNNMKVGNCNVKG